MIRSFGTAVRRAFDLLCAALILAALIAAAVHLTSPRRDRLAGYASVIDGDSLRLAGAEIRLAGLDAPELRQTCIAEGRTYGCGENARRELAKIAARPLTCETTGRDRYGRRLARCAIEGRDLGALLVGKGLAVAYGAYAAEEAEARRQKAGLWAGTFDSPEEWRKAHPTP